MESDRIETLMTSLLKECDEYLLLYNPKSNFDASESAMQPVVKKLLRYLREVNGEDKDEYPFLQSVTMSYGVPMFLLLTVTDNLKIIGHLTVAGKEGKDFDTHGLYKLGLHPAELIKQIKAISSGELFKKISMGTTQPLAQA